MGSNVPGSREYRNNERAAQERHGVPRDKAGRDYTPRQGMDMGRFRDNYDLVFRSKGGPRKNEVPA